MSYKDWFSMACAMERGTGNSWPWICLLLAGDFYFCSGFVCNSYFFINGAFSHLHHTITNVHPHMHMQSFKCKRMLPHSCWARIGFTCLPSAQSQKVETSPWSGILFIWMPRLASQRPDTVHLPFVKISVMRF